MCAVNAASLTPRASLARALVVLAWGGAIAGAGLIVDGLTSPDASVPAPRATAPVTTGPKVGDRLVTSFGTVSVDYVARLTGGPRPMGVKVAPGQLAIQVGVTLTNVERTPVRWTPAMFRVPGAASAAIDLGRLPGDAVRPLRAHRFILRYAVADAATLPRLRFRDPGAPGKTLDVALGRRADLGTLNAVTHAFEARR